MHQMNSQHPEFAPNRSVGAHRNRKVRRALLAAAAVAVTSCCVSQNAQAASATWTGTAGDGLWQTPTNWDNGVPGATGSTTNTDVATFSGSPPTDNVTVTLDANRNVGGITFNNNPGSTTSWVVGGAGPNGGNPLILTNGGTIQLANISPTIPFVDNVNAPLILAVSSYTFSNNATDGSNLGGFHFWGNITPGSAAPVTTLTLDGVQGASGSAGSEIIGALSDGNLGGKLSIVKNGTGTWRMAQSGGSSANTYSGDTIINAGVLRTIGGNDGDGTGGFSANSHYVIRSGATVRNGVIGSSMRSVEIDFGGTLLATTAATNTLNFASNSEPALQFNFGAPSSTTLVTVGMPMTFTGTTPNTGGIKLITATGPNGSPSVDLGATGSAFNMGSIARVFDIGKGADGNTYDLRVRGPMSGNGGIIKKGAGVLRLGNASLGFTGAIDIEEGGVRIDSASPFTQNVNIVVKAGATLSVATQATTILNLNVNSGPALFLDYADTTNGTGNAVSAPISLTGTVANEGGVKLSAGANTAAIDLGGTSSPLDLGSVVRTFDIAHGNPANAYDLRVRGPVNGAGGIVKTGAGILRLDATAATANSFTGQLEVQAGTVEVSNTNTLSGLPTLLIDGGAFHVFGGQTQTVGAVTVTKGSTIASDTLSTIAAPSYTFNVGAGDTATIGTALADGGAAAPLVKNGDGSVTLSGTLSYTGNTTVNAGTLSLATDLVTSSGVTVTGTGSKLELRTTATPNRVIHTPSVTVTAGGKIDIKNNKLITATPIGTRSGATYSGITGLIQSGRGTGTWNGATGIVTSQTDATSGILTSVGVATAQQVKGLSSATDTSTWAGQQVTGSDTLVMYTYGGDANLDGKIDISDYGRIDFNIPLGVGGWFNGDFNYDGKIDISDYGIIDFNIGIQGAQFPTSGGVAATAPVAHLDGVAAVPEPASFAVIALGSGLLLRRRRR